MARQTTHRSPLSFVGTTALASSVGERSPLPNRGLALALVASGGCGGRRRERGAESHTGFACPRARRDCRSGICELHLQAGLLPAQRRLRWLWRRVPSPSPLHGVRGSDGRAFCLACGAEAAAVLPRFVRRLHLLCEGLNAAASVVVPIAQMGFVVRPCSDSSFCRPVAPRRLRYCPSAAAPPPCVELRGHQSRVVWRAPARGR